MKVFRDREARMWYAELKTAPKFCCYCQKKLEKPPFYVCTSFNKIHCIECKIADWGFCSTLDYHEHFYVEKMEVIKDD